MARTAPVPSRYSTTSSPAKGRVRTVPGLSSSENASADQPLGQGRAGAPATSAGVGPSLMARPNSRDSPTTSPSGIGPLDTAQAAPGSSPKTSYHSNGKESEGS